MTTCTFDGMFDTDGDNALNWAGMRLPRPQDHVIIKGNLQSWAKMPDVLSSFTVLRGATVGRTILASDK